MCRAGYHRNGFVATRALGHMMNGYDTTLCYYYLYGCYYYSGKWQCTLLS